MDTKPLETEALRQIEASLLKYNFKCADLSFDEDGADIFVIKKVEYGSSVYWKCIRCQSKGRDVSQRSSSVVIPQGYVRDDFLLFLYVKPEDVDDSKTYLFTANDIRCYWQVSNGMYKLYLPKNYCNNHLNDGYLFNKKRAEVIEDFLTDVDRNLKDRDVVALTDAEFYFEMWKKTGGMPPYEYLIDLFSDDNMDYIVDTEVFIFMLCASVVVNYNNIYDHRLSIDWAFQDLKMFEKRINGFKEVMKGESYHSDVAMIFSRTWVQELLTENGQLEGYHLHMADNEEAVDAWVIKNGEYGVMYNGNIETTKE